LIYAASVLAHVLSETNRAIGLSPSIWVQFSPSVISVSEVQLVGPQHTGNE